VRYGQGGKNKGFIFSVFVFVRLIYGFLIVDSNIEPSVFAISEVRAGVTLSSLVK